MLINTVRVFVCNNGDSYYIQVCASVNVTCFYTEVIVSDTIPLNPEADLHKFTVLSCADIFAEVIERVHNYKEISSIFFH